MEKSHGKHHGTTVKWEKIHWQLNEHDELLWLQILNRFYACCRGVSICIATFLHGLCQDCIADRWWDSVASAFSIIFGRWSWSWDDRVDGNVEELMASIHQKLLMDLEPSRGSWRRTKTSSCVSIISLFRVKIMRLNRYTPGTGAPPSKKGPPHTILRHPNTKYIIQLSIRYSIFEI